MAKESAPAPGAPDDDVKRKFREALDRKNAKAQEHDTEVHAGGKVGGAHGPEAHQRTFRRKSG